MAAATKKFMKDVADALMFSTGSTEISADMAQHILGSGGPFPSGDAFADAAAGQDEAQVLQRAMTYGSNEGDPSVVVETFTESINKGLPELAAMSVVRAVTKAAGAGSKTCAMSALCPLLRDAAKKSSVAHFVKEIFKAWKGAPPKKPPPPPPAAGAALQSSRSESAAATETSASSGRKVFAKKAATTAAEDTSNASSSSPSVDPASSAASAAAETTASVKKTFAKKPAASEAAAESAAASAAAASAESTVDSGEAVGGSSGKKVFTKKRSETPVEAPPPAATPASCGSNPPTPDRGGGHSETAAAAVAEETSVSVKKTFAKRATPATASSGETVAPASISSAAADTSAADVGSARKTFGGTSSPQPSVSRKKEDDAAAAEAQALAVKKPFGTKAGSSDAVDSSVTVSPPSVTMMMSSPGAAASRFGAASPNAMTSNGLVVQERSSTGAVITPRCPECQLRKLVRTSDAQCQTDWGARFMTRDDALANTTAQLLRNDISAAVDEANSRANQLLEMKRQFVEARMKTISEAEEAILRSLPLQDRLRLTEQHSGGYGSPKDILTSPSSSLRAPPPPPIDPIRAARLGLMPATSAAQHYHTLLLPDDEEAYARLREGANTRIRELAAEEAAIKAQLEMMERGRDAELSAASRARAMLLSHSAPVALMQYQMQPQIRTSVSPTRNLNAASAWSATSSPSPGNRAGHRTKRW